MSDDSIKLMSLLDELEELISTSSKMPFSKNGIIDLEMAQQIIEDIRLNLPKDIKQAIWLQQEQDRILDDAKEKYNKVILQAKDQAEYLVENDAIKKEAEKRAEALIAEAENHSQYMKIKAYEYVDKLLYDMQNDITSVAASYIDPMNNYFTDMLNNINIKVNSNRQELKEMADRVQGGGVIEDILSSKEQVKQ